MEVIKSKINRVVYYNETNGYAVISFFILEIIEGTIAKNQDKITAVGTFTRIPLEDELYTIRGELVFNERYGNQLKITSYEKDEPESLQAIISYLTSDLFKGIGIATATTVVKILGADTLKIIKTNPDILEGINITKKQRQIIKEGILSDEENQQARLFLLNHGLTFDMSNKIVKTLEKNNVTSIIDTIKENPYILIDIVERFGFKKADALALDIGIEKTADIRLHAVLKFILKEMIFNSGNTYVYQNELIEGINRYLNETIDYKILTNIINDAFNLNEIYIDYNKRIFDKYLYQFENDLAKEVSLFVLNERNKEKETYKPSEIENELNQIIKNSDFSYSEKQIEAIKQAFLEPIVIITGGPGSGKTTIVKAIIEMYFRLNKNNKQLQDYIALVAPTGRAAKRLSESTKLEQACTIHRYLGYQGDGHYEYNNINKTTSRLIIVDEASMMDTELASRLFTSLRTDARIIIVGDVDQLPSVGPGQVLKDLIETNLIRTIRLDKIHRQQEGSMIISLAHDINQGIIPNDILEKKTDRAFINISNDKISKTIVDCYMAYINKGHTIKDIEILVPMYKGTSGINEINDLIQEQINPADKSEIDVVSFNTHYRMGDKVIQLVNRANDGIMNGDIGYIQGFEKENGKVKKIIVEYDNYKITYELEELDQISLAYAISIHKSQGSEFKTVVVPFSTSHYVMLKRKLIYTAITRAKEKLVMIGDLRALSIGVSRIEINRNTILKEKIIDFVNNYHNNINKNINNNSNNNNNNTESQEDILGAKEINFDDFN